jgi:hypothetical protein
MGHGVEIETYSASDAMQKAAHTATEQQTNTHNTKHKTESTE